MQTANKKRIAAQNCPLCKMPQDVIVNGTFTAKEDGLMYADKDKGYSFCNCSNIFFTDWSNMDQGSYDDGYVEKYNTNLVKKVLKQYAVRYFPQIQDLLSKKKSVSMLEIGCINDSLLDVARDDMGWNTTGLDVVPHKSDHEFVASNFEDCVGLAGRRFDVIWASHVWEHFKDPVRALSVAKHLLYDGGVIFISMPDPYFIDWKSPYLWGHWHLKEHHIMWDMDSFCSRLVSKGYDVVVKRRNPGVKFICTGDFHIVAQFTGLSTDEGATGLHEQCSN